MVPISRVYTPPLLHSARHIEQVLPEALIFLGGFDFRSLLNIIDLLMLEREELGP